MTFPIQRDFGNKFSPFCGKHPKEEEGKADTRSASDITSKPLNWKGVARNELEAVISAKGGISDYIKLQKLAEKLHHIIDLRVIFQQFGDEWGKGWMKNDGFALEGDKPLHILHFQSKAAELLPESYVATRRCKTLLAELYDMARRIETCKNYEDLKNISISINEAISKLHEGESLYVPGGWIGIPGDHQGHALMYQVVKSGGRFIFSILNTGAGLEYHRELEPGCHDMALSWKNIPQSEITNSLFWDSLLSPLVVPVVYRDEKPYFNANSIYTIAHTFFGEYDRGEEEYSPAMKGRDQRAGTCARKSIDLPMRGSPDYKLYRIEQRLIYLNVLFYKLKSEALSDEECLLAHTLLAKGIGKCWNACANYPAPEELVHHLSTLRDLEVALSSWIASEKPSHTMKLSMATYAKVDVDFLESLYGELCALIRLGTPQLLCAERFKEAIPPCPAGITSSEEFRDAVNYYSEIEKTAEYIASNNAPEEAVAFLQEHFFEKIPPLAKIRSDWSYLLENPYQIWRLADIFTQLMVHSAKADRELGFSLPQRLLGSWHLFAAITVLMSSLPSYPEGISVNWAHFNAAWSNPVSGLMVEPYRKPAKELFDYFEKHHPAGRHLAGKEIDRRNEPICLFDYSWEKAETSLADKICSQWKLWESKKFSDKLLLCWKLAAFSAQKAAAAPLLENTFGPQITKNDYTYQVQIQRAEDCDAIKREEVCQERLLWGSESSLKQFLEIQAQNRIVTQAEAIKESVAANGEASSHRDTYDLEVISGSSEALQLPLLLSYYEASPSLLYNSAHLDYFMAHLLGRDSLKKAVDKKPHLVERTKNFLIEQIFCDIQQSDSERSISRLLKLYYCLRQLPEGFVDTKEIDSRLLQLIGSEECAAREKIACYLLALRADSLESPEAIPEMVRLYFTASPFQGKSAFDKMIYCDMKRKMQARRSLVLNHLNDESGRFQLLSAILPERLQRLAALPIAETLAFEPIKQKISQCKDEDKDVKYIFENIKRLEKHRDFLIQKQRESGREALFTSSEGINRYRIAEKEVAKGVVDENVKQIESYNISIENEKKKLPLLQNKRALFGNIFDLIKRLESDRWHLIGPVLLYRDKEMTVEIDLAGGVISFNGALLNAPYIPKHMIQDPKWKIFKNALEYPLEPKEGFYFSREEGFEKLEFHNNLSHDVYYRSDEGIRYFLLSEGEGGRIALPSALEGKGLSKWVAVDSSAMRFLVCSHRPSGAPEPYLTIGEEGIHSVQHPERVLLETIPDAVFDLFKGIAHNPSIPLAWSDGGGVASFLEFPIDFQGKAVAFSLRNGKWVWEQNPSFHVAFDQSCSELGYQGAHLVVENAKGERRLLLSSETMRSLLSKKSGHKNFTEIEFLISIPLKGDVLSCSGYLQRIAMTYRKIAASDFLGAKKLIIQGLFPVGRQLTGEELLLLSRLLDTAALPIDHSREFALLQLLICYQLYRHHSKMPVPRSLIEALPVSAGKSLLISLLEDGTALSKERYNSKRSLKVNKFKELYADIVNGSKSSALLSLENLFSKEEEMEMLGWVVGQDFFHQMSHLTENPFTEVDRRLELLEEGGVASVSGSIITKASIAEKAPSNSTERDSDYMVWNLLDRLTDDNKPSPLKGVFPLWSPSIGREECAAMYSALKGSKAERRDLERMLLIRTQAETFFKERRADFNSRHQNLYFLFLTLLRGVDPSTLPELPGRNEWKSYYPSFKAFQSKLEEICPKKEKKLPVSGKDPIAILEKVIGEYEEKTVGMGQVWYNFHSWLINSLGLNLQNADPMWRSDSIGFLMGLAEKYLANPKEPSSEFLQLFPHPTEEAAKGFIAKLASCPSILERVDAVVARRKALEKRYAKNYSQVGKRIAKRWWKDDFAENRKAKLNPDCSAISALLKELSFSPIDATDDKGNYFIKEEVPETPLPHGLPELKDEPLYAALMEGLLDLNQAEGEKLRYTLKADCAEPFLCWLREELSSLESTLDTLEKRILTLANPSDIKSIVQHQNALKEPLSIDSCIGLCLRGSKELWRERTQLGDEELSTLSTLLATWLILKSEAQYAAAGIELVKEGSCKKLSEWAASQRSYDPSKEIPLHILVFEYASGLRYRARQKKVADELLEGGVSHLEMGAGKSSAIGPVASVAAADVHAINSFCLPDNTYGTGAVNFCQEIFSRFGCKGIELKFSRETCCRKELLQLIFTIERCRMEGNVLIHRPRDLYSLNLLFFERLEQIHQIKQEVINVIDLWLTSNNHLKRHREAIFAFIFENAELEIGELTPKELADLMKFKAGFDDKGPLIKGLLHENELIRIITRQLEHRLKTIYDEWDTIFDPKNQHCFPVGTPRSASQIAIIQSSKLYFHYLVPYEEELQFFGNGQLFVDEKKWKEIKGKLVEDIARDYAEHFEQYELKNYLQNSDMIAADVFYEKLLSMEVSSVSYNKRVAQEIAFLYYALNVGLPMAMKAKGGVGYCQSEKDKKLELAIPAEYNGTPKEGTRFRSSYETAFKTAQYHRQFWKREDQTRNLLAFLQQQIEKGEGRELEKAIESLFERRLTDELLQDQAFLKWSTAELQRALNPKSKKFAAGLQLIGKYLECHLLPHQLKIDAVQISNTPQDLASIAAKSSGFSGTRSFADSWPHSISHKEDPLTDAFTVRALCRPENQRVALFESRGKVPAVEELMKGANLKMLSAFIDAGPVFTGESNFPAAKAFLDFFTSDLAKRDGYEKGGVLFFMPQGDGTSKLALWKAGQEGPQLLENSNKETIEAALDGISFERIFTYFDHANSIGANIYQFSGAQAIVSVSADLTKDKFLQACDRMRGLVSGEHTLLFVLSKHNADQAAAFFAKKAEVLTTTDLLRYTAYTQQEKEKAVNPSGAMEKFTAALRRQIRSCLLEEVSEVKRKMLYEKYRQYIVQTQGDSLVSELGKPTLSLDSLAVLENEAARWKKCGECLPPDKSKLLNAEIDNILAHYAKEVPLPANCSASCEKFEQTVTVEADQSSDVDKNLLQDIRLDVELAQKIPLSEKKWPDDLDEKGLFDPLPFGAARDDGVPAVYSLKEALGAIGAFLPENFFISANLAATFTTSGNALLTQDQKPLHHLLYIEEEGREKVVAVTLEESDFFICTLEKRRAEKVKRHRKIELVEPHGALVASGEAEPLAFLEGNAALSGDRRGELFLSAMLVKGDIERLSKVEYRQALNMWLARGDARKAAALLLEEVLHARMKEGGKSLFLG